MKSDLQAILWPVIAGILFGLCAWLWISPTPNTAQPTYLTSFASAVDRAKYSVASIHTSEIVYQQTQGAFGKPSIKESVKANLGSAVIVSSDGYLLTNHHVVDGADAIMVTLYDGRSTRARVVGSDPESDLAVLWIDLNGLKPAQFGSPNHLRVGDIVLAIGNPYGFGHTVTQGIISATGRWGLDENRYENYLQTDADINVGNSGGALIDTNGELIGINTAIYARSGGSTGIGLAIPVDIAEQIMEQLIQTGSVVRGWLGISAVGLSQQHMNEHGLDVDHGVFVSNVVPGGPANVAGIQAGDIIVAIDNQALRHGRDGMLQVSMLHPGQEITVDVIRGVKPLSITATVGRKPTT